MHTTLAEIVEAIEDDRTALVAASRELTQEQLDFRPDAERWSVGENLDHLAKVEKGIALLLKKNIAQVHTAGVAAAPAAPSQLASLDQFQIATNPRKLQSPERIAPRHGVGKQELFAALAATRRDLREAIEVLAEYDLAAINFPHPFIGALNLYQWILFIGQHERRHLNQINSVLADSRFPSVSRGLVNP